MMIDTLCIEFCSNGYVLVVNGGERRYVFENVIDLMVKVRECVSVADVRPDVHG